MEYDPLMQPESELLIPGHVPRLSGSIKSTSNSKKIQKETNCSDDDQLLYMLINNEGNQIRRPKMTLRLLSEEASMDVDKGPG